MERPVAVPTKLLIQSLTRNFHVTRWKKSVTVIKRTASKELKSRVHQESNVTSISRYGGNEKRQFISTALRLFCDVDRSEQTVQQGAKQLSAIAASDIFYGDHETDFELLALYLNGCALMEVQLAPSVAEQLYTCSLEDASVEALDSIIAALTLISQHRGIDATQLVQFCERVTPVLIAGSGGPLVGRLLVLHLIVVGGGTVASSSQVENVAFLCNKAPEMTRSLFFVFLRVTNALRQNGPDAVKAALRENCVPLFNGAAQWIDGASADETVLLWRVLLWLCAELDQHDVLDLVAHSLTTMLDLCDDATTALLLGEHKSFVGVASKRFKKLPASWMARLQQLDDAGWQRIAETWVRSQFPKSIEIDALRRECRSSEC